jgi:hypothetical protein
MGGALTAADPADYAGTGGTPAQGDVPAVAAAGTGAEDEVMDDWDVVSHTLWSIIPGVIIIVAVVLCMLEFLGLRGAEANPVATGRKPQILCIILLGSGGASAPLVQALLDLQHANGFRVVGDMLHNFATVFILCKVISQRSVAGTRAAAAAALPGLAADPCRVHVLLMLQQACHGTRPACTR